MTFKATFNSSQETFSAGFGSIHRIAPGHYSGEYEVIPTQVEQVLETDGLLLDSNITVKPIPQNYGLITWNGSTLTVS